jgi:hypothetical protein
MIIAGAVGFQNLLFQWITSMPYNLGLECKRFPARRRMDHNALELLHRPITVSSPLAPGTIGAISFLRDFEHDLIHALNLGDRIDLSKWQIAGRS